MFLQYQNNKIHYIYTGTQYLNCTAVLPQRPKQFEVAINTAVREREYEVVPSYCTSACTWYLVPGTIPGKLKKRERKTFWKIIIDPSIDH